MMPVPLVSVMNCDLKPINPKIVFCNISGYGMTGPRSAEPGSAPGSSRSHSVFGQEIKLGLHTRRVVLQPGALSTQRFLFVVQECTVPTDLALPLVQLLLELSPFCFEFLEAMFVVGKLLPAMIQLLTFHIQFGYFSTPLLLKLRTQPDF